MMEATDAAGERQARPLIRPPDVLSILRVPLAALFVIAQTPWARSAILAAAALSDLLDGFWARRAGGSRVGTWLDPVCDKIFMGAAFFAVFQSRLLPPLEIAGALLRDLVAVAAFLGTLVLGRPTALPARAGGKAVTLCQLFTLAAFVADSDLLRPLAWATAAISVYAIADYGRVAWRL
jgi:phosphatidylglycerophosphate synthase